MGRPFAKLSCFHSSRRQSGTARVMSTSDGDDAGISSAGIPAQSEAPAMAAGSASSGPVSDAASTTSKSSEAASSSAGAVSPLLAKIEELKAQQAKMIRERRAVAKDLRNAERKRRRLKDKAKSLSDADLAQVLALRTQHAQELAQKKQKQGNESTGAEGGGAGA